ncbi:MAG: helix-turn-helix domain-containing protein [Polyangiales bacterium]
MSSNATVLRTADAATLTLPPPTRHCKILVVPGALSLDVMGPLDVLMMASRVWENRGHWDPTFCAHAGEPGASPEIYTGELISQHGGAVVTSSQVPLVTARATCDVVAPFDTLLVAGGTAHGIEAAMQSSALNAEIVRLAALARRVTSVCTGAFLLAAAGLLRGRRATTHWASCSTLADMFPDIAVERDPIYTRDGNVYTSAGATAGMDLALALVREDFGSALAQEVARWLVLFVQRPAGQPQLSAELQSRPAQRQPLRELQAWIVDHPSADLRVPVLAQKAGMSPRNFARAFARELGVTPAIYVEKARLEAACRRLELGDAPLDQVARDAGFGDVGTLRRAFKRGLGVGPSEYRNLRRRSDL